MLSHIEFVVMLSVVSLAATLFFIFGRKETSKYWAVLCFIICYFSTVSLVALLSHVI